MIKQFTPEELIRQQAARAFANERELVIYDPWTPNKLRAMTHHNSRAKKLENPNHVFGEHDFLAGSTYELDLGWLPEAIGMPQRMVIKRPTTSIKTRLNPDNRLNGEITLMTLGERNVIATLRDMRGVPAAVSVQLTGNKRLPLKEAMTHKTLHRRLVAYIGTRDGISAALGTLYAFMSNTSELQKHVRDARRIIRDTRRDWHTTTLKGDILSIYDLAGAPDTAEAKLFAKVKAHPAEGLRFAPSYANPLLMGDVKSRRLQAG